MVYVIGTNPDGSIAWHKLTWHRYSKGWPLYQLDALNAVVEVQMEQPPGFVA